MKKHWYMPLDVGKWFSDSRISSLTSSQRGIFIDLKSRMHDDDRCGMICKTFEQVAQLARCTVSELRDGLETLKCLFEVSERDGLISIVDLEMRKEWKIRKNRELRNKRYRSKENVDSINETANKTAMRRSSFNYSCNSELVPPEKGCGEKPIPPKPIPKTSPDEFMAAWNTVQGVVSCREMTEERRKKLAVRLRTPGWERDWPQALVKIDKSEFCKGSGRDGWKADIDWFLQPTVLTKVLEGKYDNRRSAPASQRELKVFAAP